MAKGVKKGRTEELAPRIQSTTGISLNLGNSFMKWILFNFLKFKSSVLENT